MTRLLILAALFTSVIAAVAYAQPTTVADPVPTNNVSTKIATAGTYTQLLPSVPVNSGARRSLTIENNNASDTCWLIIGTTQVQVGTTATASNVTINGGTLTAAQASIELLAGGSYQRYYPYAPSDAIYGACLGAGDSIYVDTQ